MIHVVICKNKSEMNVISAEYRKVGLLVCVYGPAPLVQAEKLVDDKPVDCGDCAAGGNAYLVVARGSAIPAAHSEE